MAITDDDDDEEVVETNTSFSKKLINFKKSPVKRGARISIFSYSTSSTLINLVARKSRSNASDDDDDFIVPDSDTDVKSVKSSSSRSTASRRSVASSDESSDDDVPKKSMPKAKVTAKKTTGTKTVTATEGTSGSTNSFLTAAEQREQGKKNDKKAAEEAYSFLSEVQDVRFGLSTNLLFLTSRLFQKERRRPGDPDYDPRTLYIPPRAWKDFTPFEKQVC
jgi:DNA mismatch repair protein MSH6